MYYKEWSTDPYWLPEKGICLLQESNSRRIPTGQPSILHPVYDKSMLDQVEVTIERIRGYLDKSGASAWWKKWLANVCADKTEREATGTACTLAIGHLLLHIIIHIIVSSR